MRKGQANTLVLIILLIIILYIVILPPEEREALLEDSGKPSTPSKSVKKVDVSVLLEEFPGTLSFQLEDKKSIDISNVNLIEAVESKVLAKFSPFSIRNGVFDKRDKTVEFNIPNLENTDNVFLSFTVQKYKGELIIKLNGQLIYQYEITSQNIEPIEFKKSLLKDSNTLEFSVGSVGWQFWRTNEYSLEDVKIIGEITDLSRQKSQNSFVLTSSEAQNIERPQLKFIPFCGKQEIGNLELAINNKNVYSSVPICEETVALDINPELLNEGTNTIVFRSSKGSYSIEQIKLDLDLKETKSIIYYFEITAADFSNVENNKKDVILAMHFIDDKSSKSADISVNGHKFRVEQTRAVFTKNIDSFVEEGNNFIEVTPKETLNIVELNVSLKSN